MKLLTWTAIVAFAAGVLTLVVTGATWPSYNAAQAYLEAANAADFAGLETPSALAYATAPAGFALGHQVALYAGAAVLSFGLLAGLLTLHARAVREVTLGGAHA